MKRALFALLLALSSSLALAIDPMTFASPEEEARFRALVAELRCLVCQNQNLADSDAGLARDLRNEVHAMLRAGKSDAEIREFMVQRYGDFVLYRPPLKAQTMLLWLGPGLLLLAGGVLVFRVARQRAARAPAAAPLDEDLP